MTRETRGSSIRNTKRKKNGKESERRHTDKPEIPFEYCALRYLLQWGRSEKKLRQNIKKPAPSIENLKSALSFFQIARNFPGLKKNSRAQFIIDALTSLDSGIRGARKRQPETTVPKLASKLRPKFKQFNLSAASKLLWLRHRTPYIIYDKRTVNALKGLGESFDVRNYHEYCVAWRNQYERHKSDIKDAASRLTRISHLLPARYVSDKSMPRTIRQRWFLERVFDIYLWEIGIKD